MTPDPWRPKYLWRGGYSPYPEVMGRTSRPHPILMPGDLLLDALCVGDVPAIVAGDNDPEHAYRFGWKPGESTGTNALAFVHDSAKRWRRRQRVCFAVRRQDSGVLLGGVELNFEHASEGRATISYWTYSAHRCQGIASTAVGAVCRFGFEELGLERIGLVCEPDNLGSVGVAVHAGFHLEGRLRSFIVCDGKHRDMLLYSLLRSD